MIRSTTIAFGVLLLAASVAQAGGGLASGPIVMTAGDDYQCAVANIGTKEIASVTVDAIIDGGTIGTTATCAPLAIGAVCTATGSAGATNERFCKATGVSKNSGRGSLCNETTGVCLPLN